VLGKLKIFESNISVIKCRYQGILGWDCIRTNRQKVNFGIL